MRFLPGRGTTDQRFTLSRILEVTWEIAQPVYMCFVDLEILSRSQTICKQQISLSTIVS